MLTTRQREAVIDDRSLCVTAGAGTGKTKVLVDRYLRLLEEGKAPVQSILALTFTEKAAAEMRDRVRNSLMEGGAEREGLLEDLHWAAISTFHSFCTGLLREFPVESGVDPGFVVLEDFQSEKFFQEAFQELVYRGTGSNTEEVLVPLLSSAGSWRMRQYLELLYRKRQAAEQAFTALKDPAQVKDWWHSMRRRHRSSLLQEVRHDEGLMGAMAALRDLAGRYAGDADRGAEYLREAAPFLQIFETEVDDDRSFQAILGLYGVRGARNIGSQKHFGSDLVRFHAALGTMKDRLKHHHDLEDEMEPEDEIFVEHAAHFLYRLKLAFSAFLAIIGRMKRERNAIDFDDMILAVRSMLVRHDDVRLALAQRYHYVMVDEFQDTDRSQVEIIKMVLGGERDKLFVVGDAKQSIYLFRQVDVSVFKEVQGFILGALSGETVDLDVNHRSTPAVIGFVNLLFERIMDQEERPWEFLYSRIEPSPERIDDQGSVELMLVPEPGEGMSEKMAQATMVARKILMLMGPDGAKVYWDGRERREVPRRAEPQDITILLRSRTNLRFYEKQLRDHGIPYHVHSGLGFFARQEVVDVYNILRFLNNPLDDVSLYGVLRSPFFGLSDAELFWMSEGSKRPLFLRLRDKAVTDPRLESCWQTLRSWQEVSGRLPVSELLTQVLVGSGIYGVYAGLDDGEQMLANLEKIRALVRSAQSMGFLALPDLVELLRQRTEEDIKEGQAQLDLGSGDSVNLMTVHAAKGLEFPLVIVPELDSRSKEDHDILQVDDGLGIGIKVPHPRTMEMRASSLKRHLDKVTEEKRLAELKRLLYVACTRAKDHLVLCGFRPSDKRIEREGKDWMVLIWRALDLTDDDMISGTRVLQDRGRSTTMRITSDLPGGPVASRIPPAPKTIPPDLNDWRARGGTVEDFDDVVLTPSKDPEAPTDLDGLKCFTTSALADTPETRGDLVHEVMQGKDPTLVLRQYGQADLTGERAIKLTRTRQRFLESNMMCEVLVDRREQPFEMTIDGRRCSGRMDRLVQTKDGQWQVIDFKTGLVSKARAKEKVKEHAPQMMLYRRAAEAMLGRPVRTYLYFTETGTFEEVK